LGPRFRGDERGEAASERGGASITDIAPDIKSTSMAPTLTSEAWTQIRFDYEHSERPIAEICAEHGISSGTLRDRMRRWGWRRRRPPIPREGPPPLPAPVVEMRAVASVALPLAAARVCDEASSDLNEGSPHPAASPSLGGDPPHKGEGQGGEAAAGEPADSVAPARQIAAGEDASAFTVAVAAFEDAALAEIDDGALVPRLQGAVARVLPAIEAIVGRLAAGAMHPREMERAGRALGVLTRTLRELNGLLGERRPPVPAADAAGSGRPGKPAEDDDGGPRDMEEFRQVLIRRINAVIAAREENAEGGATAAGEAGEPGDPLPSPSDAESGNAPQSGHAPRLGPQVRSV
jgi:transposase-like protein